MVQTLATETDPELIDLPEECPITVWQERYPDRWLLVEVRGEEDGEPLSGRLLAVATADMLLVPLWQEQAQQGKVIALLYGRSTKVGPLVVA